MKRIIFLLNWDQDKMLKLHMTSAEKPLAPFQSA